MVAPKRQARTVTGKDIDIQGTLCVCQSVRKSSFPPKQIGKVMSEVLVLGFPDGDGEVCMVSVDPPVPDGGRLY